MHCTSNVQSSPCILLGLKYVKDLHEKKHAVFVLCSVSLAIKKTKEELHQSINIFNKQLAHFSSLIAVTIPPILGLCSLCILLEPFLHS